MAKRFRYGKTSKKQPLNLGIILIAVFVAIIMITSILGYMWKDDETSQKYNGFSFRKTPEGWILKQKGSDTQLRFEYLPSEVERISIGNDIIEKLGSAQMFYMTYNPNTENTLSVQAISFVQYDLQQSLWNERKVYTQLSFTELSEEYDLPIITCINATPSVPVLEFREAGITNVYSDGGCIIVESDSPSDFIAVKDRLLYGIFGIIK